MEKGVIYYDTEKNIYHLITSNVSLENTVDCILIEGYQTKHRYIASITVAADYYDLYEDRFVQIGGIY